MQENPTKDENKRKRQENRLDRRAEALKANLARRKAAKTDKPVDM